MKALPKITRIHMDENMNFEVLENYANIYIYIHNDQKEKSLRYLTLTPKTTITKKSVERT